MVPLNSSCIYSHHHHLGNHELINAILASLPSESALFNATERRGRITDSSYPDSRLVPVQMFLLVDRQRE